MSNADFGAGIFAPEWCETVTLQTNRPHAGENPETVPAVRCNALVVESGECAGECGDPIKSGWVFLLPPDILIAVGDTLHCRGRIFTVRGIRVCRGMDGVRYALRCVAY